MQGTSAQRARRNDVTEDRSNGVTEKGKCRRPRYSATPIHRTARIVIREQGEAREEREEQAIRP